MAALFSLAGGMSDKRFRVFPRFSAVQSSHVFPTKQNGSAGPRVDFRSRISNFKINHLEGKEPPEPIDRHTHSFASHSFASVRTGGIVQLGRWNVGPEIPRFSAFFRGSK